MKACVPADGEVFTPYGATEALPVASTTAREILSEFQDRTNHGAGVCVGTKFPTMEWKVIAIQDGPIGSLKDVRELPAREIGELIVQGPVVTERYVTRSEWNALAKIPDGETCWHRMGDVGYLDDVGRFWYCGRKSQRVRTERGTLYTEQCEAIFLTHPHVFRCALVGVGAGGESCPVIVVEPVADRWPRNRRRGGEFMRELVELALKHEITHGIRDFLFRRSLPVDIRHNSKIFREKLARWAARRISR
jgi:acyl-CoA synthetase (AMP-forming)/AMP-acid ligase II